MRHDLNRLANFATVTSMASFQVVSIGLSLRYLCEVLSAAAHHIAMSKTNERDMASGLSRLT